MKNLLTLSLALISGLGLNSAANAITVDGGLSDWGLHQNGNASDWTPNAGVFYTVEDYTGGYNGGWVDPGWGGQAYDAEALYLTWDNTNLYVALVTGHDPSTPNNPSQNTFGPGDFALGFWNGIGPPTYTYGIETTGNFGQKGTIYKEVTWSTSPYWGGNYITSIAAGTQVGTANLAISANPVTGIGIGPIADKHWVYEFSAPWSAFNFNPGSKVSVYWTMNCANDMIEVDPPVGVDEPPVWALLGLTLPAMFWRRRRSVR
ncbi:MAG: hypothetical protein IPL99_17035 [Candidatus Competibacteraceae bacterium]|nr:hypothetical protein [Candidatus Competibacteraceae bacterium]